MNENLRSWYDDNLARKRAGRVLMISIALTAALYLIPFGFWVAYPLTLFSTLVHELGHGLTALATGGRFEQLAVYANASGVAHSASGAGDVGQALVAAGGLVGPATLAALGFLASGRERGARIFLAALAIGLAAALALFVRNPFGVVFTGTVVFALGWVVVRGTAHTRQIAAVFLSVQLALSVFSRGDYLFTDTANTTAGIMPSDVALMAEAVGGPYWLWGLVCGAFSALVLWGGASLFLRRITPRPVTKA
ncbi:MAG: M50 family metallopeptidase [Myxococcota bacterium]